MDKRYANLTEKRCSKCRETKPISEFYVDKSRYTGYKSACKPCYNKANYRAKCRSEIMSAYAVDVVGPWPADLTKSNIEKLVAAFKTFRHGQRMDIGWRQKDTLTSREKGLEFRRPTSNHARVLLHFHPPKGKTVTFDLASATVPQIADYIALHNVEIVFP